MRFLVDASMPRSTAPLLCRYGHPAEDVRDIGLGSAPDVQIAAYARTHELALVSRDGDFGDIRNYPPADYAGIVVMTLPKDTIASVVLTVLESFISQGDLLARLPGHLAIVEQWRARFRPT